MKRWRLVRKDAQGRVRAMELKFWTRWGAQRAASRINQSDGVLAVIQAAFGGTMIYVVKSSEIEFLNK